MKFNEPNYDYRILTQNFFEREFSVFTIESKKEKLFYVGSAGEIMLKSFFQKLSPKDISAIVYTFAEEGFMSEDIHSTENQ